MSEKTKKLKIDNLDGFIGESVYGYTVERCEGSFGFYKFGIRESESNSLHMIRLDRDAKWSSKWHEGDYIIETINGNPKTKSLLISQLRDKKEFLINIINLIQLSKI